MIIKIGSFINEAIGPQAQEAKMGQARQKLTARES